MHGNRQTLWSIFSIESVTDAGLSDLITTLGATIERGRCTRPQRGSKRSSTALTSSGLTGGSPRFGSIVTLAVRLRERRDETRAQICGRDRTLSC